MHEQTGRKGLDRYLSPLDVWAMSLGVMVGWGAFVMPGTSFLPVAGPLGTAIAMIIGTVVVLIIAKNISFLMNRNPQTGGVYSYTKEAFGRDHAFLCSWFLCLSYLTIVFLNASALFIGDTVLTTGGGGVFPAGLVVGTVDELRLDGGGFTEYGVLTPAAELSALRQVFVIRDYQREEDHAD